MLYKQRTAPKLLDGLLALEKRLPRHHEKYNYIAEELYNSRAGYGGEVEYDRHMKEVRTDYPHAILHDLYLQHDGVYFQLDSLFISPNTIIISEIKNRADKIVITDKPTQFIQVNEAGRSKVFRSPIAELERKIQFFEKWLLRRNIKIPVKGIVVFAYNNQIVIEGTPSMPILTTYEAPTYFRALPSEKTLFGQKEIKKVANVLIKSHREYNPFPLLKRYKIKPDQLMNGLYCSTCPVASIMTWKLRRWECSVCGVRDSDSHLKAIDEWFMLMPNKLTNQAFCDFTGIPNRHTAKRLLARTKLRQQGTGRGSRYELIP